MARRPAPSASRITLETPVTYLKGVGPARAESLAKLGIFTAGDLLYHVPHRYEDASTVSPIASLEPGMDGTVIGRVVSKGVIPTRKGLRIFQAVVRDASGNLEVSWPGQPFLDRVIQKNDVLLLTGTVRFFHGRQLQPREFVNLGAEEQGTAGGRVLAVYSATEGLSVKQLRLLVETHLDALLPQVREHLPLGAVRAAGVPELPNALRMVHRPTSPCSSRCMRRSLVMSASISRSARDCAPVSSNGSAVLSADVSSRRLTNAIPRRRSRASWFARRWRMCTHSSSS